MINALMPGEHDWMNGPVASSSGGPWTPSPSVPSMTPQSARGANVPGKKPNPLMNALGVAATTLFSNDPAASFQRKKDMQLGNALALNDYEGAAQMALKQGNLDQGMKMRDLGTAYTEQQKATEAETRQKEAQQVYQLFSNMQPLQINEFAMADPAGFEQATGMSSEEYLQSAQRMMQVGMSPEQFHQYVIQQAQAELGMGGSVEGKVVNNRLVNPVTGEVIGDYSDPAQPEYVYQQVGDEILAIDKNNPQNRISVGAAPAKSPLVNVNTGDVAAGQRPIIDKPPKGYQAIWDAENNTYRMEPIPGGEADIAAEDDANTAFQKMQTSTFTNDLVNDEIDRALENTSVWSAGWGNMLLKDLPQTQARTLNNAVTMIQANLSFDRLQQMRDESKTGGALGAVSEREIDLLQSTVQRLDTLTDPAELTRALETVRTQLNKIQNLRKQIYAQKYGGYVSGDGSGMIVPTDATDLPPGFEVVP